MVRIHKYAIQKTSSRWAWEKMGRVCGEHTLVKRAGTKVEGQVGLRANDLTPLHELVCSEFIALDADPSQLGPNVGSRLAAAATKRGPPLTHTPNFPGRIHLASRCGHWGLFLLTHLLGRFSLGPTPSIQW